MIIKKSTALHAVGSAALALALLTPAAAANSDGSDQLTLLDDNVETPSINDSPQPSSTATLPDETPNKEVPAEAVEKLSPAKCTGRTHYPHKSADQVSVSVHAEMNCAYSVERVETVTSIYRDRWYGQEYLISGSSSKNYSSTSGSATPHENCVGEGTHSYRAYSMHASLEAGTIYKARTSSWDIPGVSRFTC